MIILIKFFYLFNYFFRLFYSPYLKVFSEWAEIIVAQEREFSRDRFEISFLLFSWSPYRLTLAALVLWFDLHMEVSLDFGIVYLFYHRRMSLEFYKKLIKTYKAVQSNAICIYNILITSTDRNSCTEAIYF